MKKYTFDFRPTLIEYEKRYSKDDVSTIETVFETKVPSKFSFEDEHRPNVFFEDLEVGHHLYLWDDGPDFPGFKRDYRPYEIEITHIYGGVFFFKRVEFEGIQEEWSPQSSFLATHMLYPYEIITTSKFEFATQCQSLKIVVDDDLSTIGTYSTTYDYYKLKKE